MRSSSGEHFIALDHVRSLAAFMVFAWHFTHGVTGSPVPFGYAPRIFVLSLLDEGHSGVALFMTLSGYLFAKLLDGKKIRYGAFIWNRALRLLPLLIVVLLLIGLKEFVRGNNLASYGVTIAKGLIFPTLPNGGWSITVEFHYYLILPLLLWLLRKSKYLPLLIVLMAILARLIIYQVRGEIQLLAYWTIVGRIDQFALGMFAFQFRRYLANRHVVAAAFLFMFSLFYWYFDFRGGFYHNPLYPSTSTLWIFLPTIEGIAYSIGIAWYDSSFSPSLTGISGLVGHIGAYSYSIYLFHFFVVFRAAQFVNEQVMPISNFYLACAWAVGCFLLMTPVGYLSFRFIESPFLRMRKRYSDVDTGTTNIDSASDRASLPKPLGKGGAHNGY
jgi:peptidoglycan/LPS O-acetylase OafA/YrhL